MEKKKVCNMRDCMFENNTKAVGLKQEHVFAEKSKSILCLICSSAYKCFAYLRNLISNYVQKLLHRKFSNTVPKTSVTCLGLNLCSKNEIKLSSTMTLTLLN